MNPKTYRNWSEQFHCTPQRVHQPRSEAGLAAILGDVAKRDQHARVFASGLSPGDIAMSDEDLILTSDWSRVVSIDAGTRQAVVEPGVTLEKLSHALATHGLALPVLSSIAQQTLAGALATATHGTGIQYGNFSTWLQAARLVTPQGEVLAISEQENADLLPAARCHLGGLGVFSQLTLQVCEAFDLAVTEQPGRLDAVLARLPERLAQDHYRFWYLPHTDKVWEWAATRTPPGAAPPPLTGWQRLNAWFQERFIDHYVYEFLLYLATYQPAMIPWINRAGARVRFGQARQSQGPSFHQFTFDCLFKQHVNEWSIPIEHTGKALRGIRDLIARKGYYAHLPIEVRFVQGDDIWLSPCQGRDSCYIGVIAYLPHGRPPRHEAYFADYEQLMVSLDGRPHWAKYFHLPSDELAQRYPHWQDFQRVRKQLDPNLRLRNRFTDRVLSA